MGCEIDLLVNYPKAKRDVKTRGNTKTEEDRRIARRFDKEFFDEVIETARKNGYLHRDHDNAPWQYFNPEAMGLAAEEVKNSNPKYKDKVDNKGSTDALNEKLREQRLKKSEMEKGKAGGGDTKQGPRPTKADYETAKKFNISVESIMKHKKVKEVTV